MVMVCGGLQGMQGPIIYFRTEIHQDRLSGLHVKTATDGQNYFDI